MKTIILVGTMSFLSAIFGCNAKTINIKGPDHDKGENTVIHIEQNLRIEYALPGNMSNQLGFDSAREKEERTKHINLPKLQDTDFERDHWRNKKFIDAGRWDYLGPQNK